MVPSSRYQIVLGKAVVLEAKLPACLVAAITLPLGLHQNRVVDFPRPARTKLMASHRKVRGYEPLSAPESARLIRCCHSANALMVAAIDPIAILSCVPTLQPFSVVP